LPPLAFSQLPEELNIQSGEIAYVGDRPSDVKFGRENGCMTVYVPSNVAAPWPLGLVPPDLQLTGLNGLVQKLRIGHDIGMRLRNSLTYVPEIH